MGKLKATFKENFFDLGFNNNCAKLAECPFYSLKNHSTLLYSILISYPLILSCADEDKISE